MRDLIDKLFPDRVCWSCSGPLDHREGRWVCTKCGRRTYFCTGRFCPGLSWPSWNTEHPSSCFALLQKRPEKGVDSGQ